MIYLVKDEVGSGMILRSGHADSAGGGCPIWLPENIQNVKPKP